MFQVTSNKERVFHTEGNLIERAIFFIWHITIIRDTVSMDAIRSDVAITA